MIGTLFRICKYIRDARQGINNPSNFAFEQLAEMALVPFVIPGLILIGILITLGILGFSNLIFSDGSGIARIFFWIFLVFAVVTATGMIAVYRAVKKLWQKTSRNIGVADKKLYDITPLQNKKD